MGGTHLPYGQPPVTATREGELPGSATTQQPSLAAGMGTPVRYAVYPWIVTVIQG